MASDEPILPATAAPAPSYGVAQRRGKHFTAEEMVIINEVVLREFPLRTQDWDETAQRYNQRLVRVCGPHKFRSRDAHQIRTKFQSMRSAKSAEADVVEISKKIYERMVRFKAGESLQFTYPNKYSKVTMPKVHGESDKAIWDMVKTTRYNGNVRIPPEQVELNNGEELYGNFYGAIDSETSSKEAPLQVMLGVPPDVNELYTQIAHLDTKADSLSASYEDQYRRQHAGIEKLLSDMSKFQQDQKKFYETMISEIASRTKRIRKETLNNKPNGNKLLTILLNTTRGGGDKTKRKREKRKTKRHKKHKSTHQRNDA